MILDTRLISIVVPMFNEESMVDIFFNEMFALEKQLQNPLEFVCINDGSKDSTLTKLQSLCDLYDNIIVVDLSRNHGKELALTAGLDYSSGDAVIPIDCDLQDPPSLIPSMIEKWNEGFDIVLAKRIDRSVDTILKRTTSDLFYKIMNRMSEIDLPANVGDFRLMDRKVVDVLGQYKEKNRFMKGIFASVGFKQTSVEYIRENRAAGVTKWNYFKLYGLALEGLISFSSIPLKIWSYLGASVAIVAMLYGFYLIVRTILFGVDVPGYASLMVVLLFMSGLILLCLGVIGEYIARIFLEVKQRPLYIVSKTYGHCGNSRTKEEDNA